MNQGDVILVRFPHRSGVRGKKRPAVIIQADSYMGRLSTVIVAEITKNLALASDPACLFEDVNTPEGRATGLIHDSVLSCLLLATVDTDKVAQVLGSLSQNMKLKLNHCLKAAMGIT